MSMFDIDVTMAWIGGQMGLKLAPLLFGKIGSAHRPTTVHPQLSSVRQTLGMANNGVGTAVNELANTCAHPRPEPFRLILLTS